MSVALPRQTATQTGCISAETTLVCSVISGDRYLIAGIKSLVSNHPEITVVDHSAVMTSGDEPSCVDLALVHVERSLAAAEDAIRDLATDERVGVLGMVGRSFSRSTMQAARRLGVTHFFSTSMTEDQLVAGMHEATRFRRLAPLRLRPDRANDAWVGQQDGLTERESQVVVFVAVGLSNRQIADRLFVSVETVRTHLKRAYHRLGLSNRAQLSAYIHDRVGPGEFGPGSESTVTSTATFDVININLWDCDFDTVGAAAWEVGPEHLRMTAISGGHIGMSVVAPTDKTSHRTLSNLFPGRDTHVYLQMFAKAKPGDAVQFEHKLILPSGQARRVRSSYVATRSRNGSTLVNGVTLDITDVGQTRSRPAS